MAHNESLSARGTSTSPFGKCDSDIKFRVPEQVKLDLAREASKLGLGESEFLRELVMVRLYGIDAVLSMDRQRLTAVAGTGERIGHEEGE